MDKYFYIKRKALSNRECEHIIKLFEKSDYRGGNHDYYSIHPRLIDSEYSFLKSVLERPPSLYLYFILFLSLI